MKFKKITFSALLLFQLPPLLFGSALSRPFIAKSEKLYWSVIKPFSPLDSLKLLNKPAIRPDDDFRKLLAVYEFNSYFSYSAKLPDTYPSSAGIYQDGIQVDSLSAFDQLLFLYRNLGDLEAEANLYQRYGIDYTLDGDLEKGEKYIRTALKLNQQANTQEGTFQSLLALSRIEAYKGDIKSALQNNFTLLNMALQSKNTRNIADAYLQRSSYLLQENRFGEAEEILLKKALPLYYYKIKDKSGVINCFNQLAATYKIQKRFSEAKWFYIQANTAARNSRNNTGIVSSLIRLAGVKTDIGDYSLALRDLKEAENISLANNYSHKLVEIKADLSELYSRLGKASESASALTEFNALKKSLLSTAD